MFSLNSMTKRVATVAKGTMLLGTAIFGWGSVANAAEIAVTAGPTLDKVVTVKVEHNLKTVVEALAIIDPVWAEGLPKTKALKRKEEEEARKKAAKALEMAETEVKEAVQPPQYVFFLGTSATDCNAINLNQYMGPSNPPTIPGGVNPEDCVGTGRCCGKAYPAANVQYNPATNRWEPISETGVQYFQKAP